MRLEQILVEFGFEPKEAKIYLASLELGPSSVMQIAKKAEIKRPTAYLILDNLTNKGFISKITRNNKLIYTAEKPNFLINSIQKKQEVLADALPEFEAIMASSKQCPKIFIREGVEGIEIIYNEIFNSLKQGQEILFFADIKTILENAPKILEHYKKSLLNSTNLQVREISYGDDEGIRWANDMKKLMENKKYYDIRLLPTDYNFGATDNIISGSKLIIFSHKKNIFAIIIESEEIAKTYRVLFEWAWRATKSPYQSP